MRFYQIDLKIIGDERGLLTVIENEKQIPFAVKRIFYLYKNVSNIPRGCHANKNSKFILISIAGSCKVKADDGSHQEVVDLNTPDKALFLDNMVWKEMYEFSEDNVLLVLSDCFFDKEEYIDTYEEFLELI